MAVAAILDSIEELDPVLQAEYTKKKIGDKEVYVLNVTSVQQHPDVKNLSTALAKQKEDNRTLKDEKAALEDKYKDVPEEFSLEDWNRFQTLDIDSSNEPEAIRQLKTAHETQVAALKKQNQERADKDKKTIEELNAANARVTADANAKLSAERAGTMLTTALSAAGVKPVLMNAAKTVLLGKVKHAVEDGDVRVFVETEVGEQTIDEFVKTWSDTDEGKGFVELPAGGGAGGGDRKNQGHAPGDNPFSISAWNKTNQSKLSAADRGKAERFAKSAGFANLDVALRATHANNPQK